MSAAREKVRVGALGPGGGGRSGRLSRSELVLQERRGSEAATTAAARQEATVLRAIWAEDAGLFRRERMTG